ncbi:hypothetical protein DY000_02055727 [Brassica cretica]|uniref:Reverse transcriptase zinc-binding domain-containing protein n=1 Tax=Brassica cretica TaxID=69181 RepID=A0ABQ7AJZ7_BRACR|nr:hypothetical protein DY000_02055727 [Brassica cretica]
MFISSFVYASNCMNIGHPIGRLIEVVGDRGRLKLSIDRKACVAEISLHFPHGTWFGSGVPQSHGVSSSGLHKEPRCMLLSFGWLSRTDFPHMSKCVLDFPHVQGCLSGGEPEESRDHLFFACQYTYTLWLEAIGSLLQPAPTPAWEEIVERILAENRMREDTLTYID